MMGHNMAEELTPNPQFWKWRIDDILFHPGLLSSPVITQLASDPGKTEMSPVLHTRICGLGVNTDR